MTAQEELSKLYPTLPVEAKRLAWEINGSGQHGFRKIVNGLVKDKSAYPLALQSVKQALKQHLENCKKQYTKVETAANLIENQ